MICYLIYPWIYEIVEDNKSKSSSQTMMILVFTFISVLALMLQKYNDSTFGIINIMLLRFPIFVLGAFIGRASYEKRIISNEWIAFVILSLFCLPLRETERVVMVRYTLAALFLSIVFIIIQGFEWLAKHKINLKILRNILTWFGNYSLELYLTHVAVRDIMKRLGFETYRIKYFLIVIAISLILSIILKKITDLINSIKLDKKAN